MAPERLSHLQRRILAWLAAEEQRTRGTMSASHEDLVRVLVRRGFDKGNVSTSLKGLAAKGLVTIARTPGGRAEAVDLTPEGRNRAAPLTASCDEGIEDRMRWGAALEKACERGGDETNGHGGNLGAQSRVRMARTCRRHTTGHGRGAGGWGWRC